MKRYNLLSVVLISVFFSSCEGLFNPSDNPNPELVTKVGREVVEQNNKFAFEFFKEVTEAEIKNNFMVSPVSLSLALGMAYNGSETSTKLAFDDVLNYDASLLEVNEFNKDLIDKLSDNSDGSVMNIANSMWIRESFPVKEEFINLNTNYYYAEVQNLDFSDPASVGIINDWVSDKTNEKIPEIIKEISPDAALFLINALYFNASWKYSFDPEYTQTETFYPSNNESVDAEMMYVTSDLDYTQNELFSSVILPYENDKFSMVVLLPNYDKSVDDIISVIDYENWNEWMDSYENSAVTVAMPKFKLNYENKLNDELIEMGLGIAFSPAEADFSNISDISLFISFVKQNTFIDVNEEGTEAAAVTIIGFELNSSAGGTEVTLFRVDRPFIYAIKENITGSICFIGKVGLPEYEEE